MSLRVVEGPFEAIPERRGSVVAGVLLAAGLSTRFGAENKLLAEVDGEPMVRRASRRVLAADLAEVVVVTGHGSDEVRAALGGLSLSFVHNPDYEAGQASSVRAGLAAVRDRADAVVFALGDMPFVSTASIDTLVGAYRAGAGDALAAAYRGRRGNPVLFEAGLFDRLAAVDGDAGGRDLLYEAEHAALVETDDPGVLRDVNTREELDRAG